MKVRVDVPDERNYYSNDDTILGEITVYRDDTDPDADADAGVASLVRSVRATLVCEGIAAAEDKEPRHFRYYTSPSVEPDLESEGADQRKYRCRFKFPSEGSEYPSTLHFDDVRDGIQWFVLAEVETRDGSFRAKRVCTFMQSGPLPNLLSLVDIEHTESIDGVQVDVITSHATAGLPQSPLSAGIGLCIECSHPRAFAAKRLRLLLLDTTEISIAGQHRFLPPHRWLLSSTVLEPPIPLQRITNLDKFTRDVQIDHASLPQTFECDEFAHSFDLAVEITLESPTTHKSRKVLSISPVTVLPRLAHTFDADELSRTSSSEIAYITDSSDDEDEHDELPNAFTQLHKEPRAYVQSSSPSSESVKSIFSDHTTKLDLDMSVPALSFS